MIKEFPKEFEKIIENLSGGIAVYRLSGKLETLMFTDGIPRMQGYTRAEYERLAGADAMNVVYQGDKQLLMDTVMAQVQANAPVHMTYRVCCKDGSLLWVNLAAFPSSEAEPDGCPVYNAVFTNVSSQFNLYQNIADDSENGIIVFNSATGEVYYTNKILYELTGAGCAQYRNAAYSEIMGVLEDYALAQADGGNTTVKLAARAGKYLRIKSRDIEWMGKSAVVQYVSDITAQINNRQMIENERERYRLIVDQTGVALIDYDFATGATFRNEAYSRYAMADMSDDALMSNTADKSIVHPDDMPVLGQFFADSRSGRGSCEAKLRLKVQDGTYRWTIMRGMFFYDADGALARSIGTFQDIDDATTRYEELQRRYKFEVARQSMPGENAVEYACVSVSSGIMRDGTSRYNKNFSAWAGKPVIETVKSDGFELVDADARPAIIEFLSRESLEAIYRSARAPRIEYRRRLAGHGQIKWQRMIAHVIKEPDSGELVAFIYTYDIDHEKMVELLMSRIAEENYDEAMLISAETDTINVYIDPGRESMFSDEGVPYDAESARHVDMYVEDEAMRRRVKEALSAASIKAALNETGRFDFSYNANMDGDVRRLRWTGAYLDCYNDDIMLTCTDITEIYRAESRRAEQLQQALDEARQASNAKTDFLSRMSHEIRTPMNAIMGMTAVALDNRSDFEQVSDCLEKINISSRYLLTLINDILEMSRIESGKMEINKEQFDFRTLMRSVDTIVQSLARKSGIRYDTVVDEACSGNYYGDMMRIQQLLVNIISNAVKFTGKGGRVRFSIKLLEDRGDENLIRFTVEDTGIGISEEFLPHVFEAFSQENSGTTSVYGGSGLGLAICKSVVEAMHGTIGVESFVGVGTTFTVELPIKHGNAPDAAQQPEDMISEDDIDLRGCNVLMAEDHPLNVIVAKRLIERKGATVTVAKNGRAAVELFDASAPGEYNMILMDIRMPVMDGLEATRRIRALKRPDAASIPIIAMTANALDTDRRNTKAAGMDAHLSKPIEPSTLYRTLWSYFDKGSKE